MTNLLEMSLQAKAEDDKGEKPHEELLGKGDDGLILRLLHLQSTLTPSLFFALERLLII